MTQRESRLSRLEATREENQDFYRSLKARADSRRTFSEKLADKLTAVLGSMTFLIFNAIWFAVWIILNVNLIPGLKPFDPFPFGFLTMVVSLEAIGLAIIVLISQNRAAKIGDLRQEVDLTIDVKAEEEITKILTLVKVLAEKNGVDVSEDLDLETMLAPTNLEEIQKDLEKEVIENT